LTWIDAVAPESALRPHVDAVDLASLDGGDQPGVLVALADALGGGVVVDVLADQGVASACEQREGVLPLTLDAQLLAGAILADPEIDRCSHRG
jgi:hypothetical protein